MTERLLYVPQAGARPALVEGAHTGSTSVGGGMGLWVNASPRLYNSAAGAYELEQTNVSFTILPTAARTADIDSGNLENVSHGGLVLIIDITAIVLTPQITVFIEGFDFVSGKYFTVLQSAALVAVATTILKVHPGLTATPNLVANDMLPRQWRIRVDHLDADSITYSIGGQLLK